MIIRTEKTGETYRAIATVYFSRQRQTDFSFDGVAGESRSVVRRICKNGMESFLGQLDDFSYSVEINKMIDGKRVINCFDSIAQFNRKGDAFFFADFISERIGKEVFVREYHNRKVFQSFIFGGKNVRSFEV